MTRIGLQRHREKKKKKKHVHLVGTSVLEYASMIQNGIKCNIPGTTRLAYISNKALSTAYGWHEVELILVKLVHLALHKYFSAPPSFLVAIYTRVHIAAKSLTRKLKLKQVTLLRALKYRRLETDSSRGKRKTVKRCLLSLISTVFNNDVTLCRLHDQTRGGRENWTSRPELQMVQNKVNYQKSIIYVRQR